MHHKPDEMQFKKMQERIKCYGNQGHESRYIAFEQTYICALFVFYLFYLDLVLM